MPTWSGRRLRGRGVLGDEEPPACLDASSRPGFAYRPMTRVPRHWHPYVQGREVDLSRPTTVLLPEAESDLLVHPTASRTHPTHLEPAAVPADGVRWNSGRCWPGPPTARRCCGPSGDGSRCSPRRPPGLRFDMLEPVPPEAVA
ncbi:hypothetical protein [Micromonospora sp. NPDC000018]|uniref:hypothetical protein n=1 Tax=Micromonospora sp. NPDC000018 TaxID=3154239 RepID=UPI003331D609